MNGENSVIWKEVVMAYFKELSWYSARGIENFMGIVSQDNQ
jgi:hypothetical protein